MCVHQKSKIKRNHYANQMRMHSYMYKTKTININDKILSEMHRHPALVISILNKNNFV